MTVTSALIAFGIPWSWSCAAFFTARWWPAGCRRWWTARCRSGSRTKATTAMRSPIPPPIGPTVQHAVVAFVREPLAVVEQVLGGGVVDGQQRVRERAFARQVACPEHAGAGHLRGAEDLAEQVATVGVQARDQVGAVVDDQGRPGGQGRVDPAGR